MNLHAVVCDVWQELTILSADLNFKDNIFRQDASLGDRVMMELSSGTYICPAMLKVYDR